MTWDDISNTLWNKWAGRKSWNRAAIVLHNFTYINWQGITGSYSLNLPCFCGPCSRLRQQSWSRQWKHKCRWEIHRNSIDRWRVLWVHSLFWLTQDLEEAPRGPTHQAAWLDYAATNPCIIYATFFLGVVWKMVHWVRDCQVSRVYGWTKGMNEWRMDGVRCSKRFGIHKHGWISK